MIRFDNIKYIYITVAMIVGMVLSSCKDELLYDNSIIGEGEASISATVSFIPMGTGLDTRASGTAVKNINNLCVLIYTEGGELFNSYTDGQLEGYKCKQDGNQAYPDDVPPGDVSDSKFDTSSESATPKATFKIPNIFYGKYRIYAVANLGDLALSEKTFENEKGEKITIKDAIKTEAGLKGIRVAWDKDVTWNTDGTKSNDDHAMFGFFTSASEPKSLGFEAPTLIINKPNIDLHCWIKRLVSKVTIAFDPSGLKEAVSVYIRSVTIHDIPATCYLGKKNEPASKEEIINDPGEQGTIYYGDGATNPSYSGWLKLQKGTEVSGSPEHKETDDALYFFENMQGDYQGQKDFLKVQIAGETGESINEPEIDESTGEVIKNENGNMKTDFKDRVPYGTYIEVEGYYVSQNKAKISKGPIKYRFMLGKNTTYNYDAERNHHYKLTLKFRGWANEADWHIVYDELEPSIIVPDPYYISYLYNQDMTYPVRVTGMDFIRDNNLHLHAQIIKNNWIPTIEKTGAMADEIIGAYNEINGFAWNKWAYEHVYDGANYAGFLSLRENKQPIVGIGQQYGEAGNEYLQKNYEGIINVTPRYWADYEIQTEGTGLGVCGDKNDGLYDVVATDSKSMTINLPMFTRPKELIPASDFSGNNPFYAYVREATVRFSLRKAGAPEPTSSKADGWKGDDDVLFKIKDKDGKEKEVKYVDVTIYQVPRIVNPKAIWRRWDNTEEFHVKLKQLNAAGSNDFIDFKSEGPWRASILQDPDGLIELYTSDGQKVTKDSKDKYIEGITGDEIDFYYKPRGTAGSADNARCGIIKVEYHDYTCHHLIFVRQGYDKGMMLGGASWSCYNAVAAKGSRTDGDPEELSSTNAVVTNSPLSIGSFFKRNNYNYAILESNEEDYGWLASVTGKELQTAYTDGTGYSTRPCKWSDIGGHAWTGYRNDETRADRPWADTWKAVNKNGKELAVPTYEQYVKLRDDCEYGYGVVYADGATGVADNVDDAYGYTNFDNASGSAADSPKGMRACLVYNSNNGDQIIFPIGAIGQGRRALNPQGLSYSAAYNGTQLSNFPNPGAGALSYGNVCGLLYAGALNENGRSNNYRPLTYNLYREPGAVYWFKQPVDPRDNALDDDTGSASWDINYYTVVFNPYSSGSLGTFKIDDKGRHELEKETSTDALPIKFIYKE